MPALSRESASSPSNNSSLVPHRSSNIMKQERMKKSGIHPFSGLLNVSDVDDCDWLEHAAFDPIEAASREKVSFCFLCVLTILRISASKHCLFVALSGTIENP